MGLSFERKVWLGFVATTAAALVIVVAAFFAGRAVLDTRDDVSAAHADNLALLERLRSTASKRVGAIQGFVATKDGAQLALLDELQRDIERDLAQLSSQLGAASVQLLLQQVSAREHALVQAQSELVHLAQAGAAEAALSEQMLTRLSPLRRELEEAFQLLESAERTRMIAARAQASADAQRSLWLIVGLTSASLLVTVVGATLLVRTFTRLYRETQQAVHVRDDFLSVASHELRTPLTTLRLTTQGLVRLAHQGMALDRAHLTQRLEASDRQVERLMRLVEQLLDVSHLGAGKLVLYPERTDLAAVAKDVAGRCEEHLTRAGCPLQLALEGPVEGAWDRARLEQVLTNLLTNAAKYGRGKPVRLQVAQAEGRARLVVRDEGIGVAPADHERIFERFERVAASREFSGFGLGLWITRQIVEAHGGSIRVESAPGAGATFVVELPLPEAEAEGALALS